ncbi:MAG: MGMT family protein [Candidatus Zixiibacteriota bacterium]|nr:MAG: MGMT family protein [candidate division Zixibacteria bacterium]
MKSKADKVSQSISFSEKVKEIIKKIPRGKVAAYGQVALYAGNPRGARQVVRILHSSSRKDRLPWHRVVNREGRISLKPNYGYEMQKAMLEDEGVTFGADDVIDMKRYCWSPIAGK